MRVGRTVSDTLEPGAPYCWNCERAGHTYQHCPHKDDTAEVDFVEEPVPSADDDLLRALDAELADVEIPDVPDYSGCDYMELMGHANRIRERLLELHEMLAPRTDEGRDLHIQRGAARSAMDNWRENHPR